MKKRLGFVSNSSSTSFTVYGVKLENESEFKDLTGIGLYDFVRDSDLDDFFGDPNEWNPSTYVGLVLSGDFEHSYHSDLREDETKGQFKQRVRDLLPESIPDDRIGMFSESFYNG